MLLPNFSVYHESSGRQLDVESSLPGMQFYSGNFMKGQLGKANNEYGKHTGFALEPQFYPDNINHVCFFSLYRFTKVATLVKNCFVSLDVYREISIFYSKYSRVYIRLFAQLASQPSSA